jgi:cold shock CspA family protein
LTVFLKTVKLCKGSLSGDIGNSLSLVFSTFVTDPEKSFDFTLNKLGMAKSQETFSKKEKEKKKLRKRQDKAIKREERKANSTGGNLDDMIAYVDEYGNISDTPPDPSKKQKVKASSIEISIPKREDGETEVKSGRIDYFNQDRGYGFIKELNGNNKYFFHINNCIGDIDAGLLVNYELEKSDRGLNAINVTKAI